MDDPFGAGESKRKKADGVADAINRLLQNLVIKCAKEEGVRDYFQSEGYFDAEVEFKEQRVINDKAAIDYLVNTGVAIQIGDVTADGRADFIVPIEAASVVQGSVISKVGGDCTSCRSTPGATRSAPRGRT